MKLPRGVRACAKGVSRGRGWEVKQKISPSPWCLGCLGGDTGADPPTHQRQLSHQDTPVQEPRGGEMEAGANSRGELGLFGRGLHSLTLSFPSLSFPTGASFGSAKSGPHV